MGTAVFSVTVGVGGVVGVETAVLVGAAVGVGFSAIVVGVGVSLAWSQANKLIAKRRGRIRCSFRIMIKAILPKW